MTVNLLLLKRGKKKKKKNIFNIISMRTSRRLPIAYTCCTLQVRLADNRAIPYLSTSLSGRCTWRISFSCFFWRHRCISTRGQHHRV